MSRLRDRGFESPPLRHLCPNRVFFIGVIEPNACPALLFTLQMTPWISRVFTQFSVQVYLGLYLGLYLGRLSDYGCFGVHSEHRKIGSGNFEPLDGFLSGVVARLGVE